MNFVRRILGVIPTGIKEETDVVGLEHLEQAIHIPSRGLRISFEIDFVAAGSQSSCWGMFEPLNGLGLFLVDIHKLFIENAVDPI